MQKPTLRSSILNEVKGSFESNDALLLLCLVAQLHGIAVDVDSLTHELALTSETPQNFDLLQLAASRLGLNANQETIALSRLHLTPLPALTRLQDGRWAIVAAANTTHVVLQYAEIGSDLSAERAQNNKPIKLTLDEFARAWLGTNENGTLLATKGQMLLLTSRASLIGELSKFDFSWFIPSLVRYRRLLAEVLGTSVVLQLFALVTPLFFQVVMDKVLVHQGLSTLNVLVIGLIAISVFESALSFLRIYVFSHTTSRIDVELGSRLFRHLLRLPLNWFQARRVGDSVARVRELENIRSFLTGQALTVVLDVMFFHHHIHCCHACLQWHSDLDRAFEHSLLCSRHGHDCSCAQAAPQREICTRCRKPSLAGRDHHRRSNRQGWRTRAHDGQALGRSTGCLRLSGFSQSDHGHFGA